MARKSTKGTTQLGVEVDNDLIAYVRDFAKSRKETMREVVEIALRRHIANPPPIIEPPPLPPMAPFAAQPDRAEDAPAKAKPWAKKKGGKK